MRAAKTLKVAFLTLAVAWFVLSIARLILYFLSDNEVVDPDNCTKKRYDKRGNLVFLQTTKEGKLHGHFKSPYPGGSAEGDYDSGFPVGTWREWYENGALRRLSLFSQLQEITNKNGFVTLKSILLERQDFTVDGDVVAVVTNGVGASVFMCGNGHDIESFSTKGFATNVTIFYGGKMANSSRYIKQVSVFVPNSNGIHATEVFSCLVDERRIIRSVNETRGSARWVDGRLVAETEDAFPPPFLCGVSRYPLPSLKDRHPIFDHYIMCTNGTMAILPVDRE